MADRLASSQTYPLLQRYINECLAPQADREIANLDVLDKSFSLRYAKLQGELDAYVKMANIIVTNDEGD